jgi:hypothetical protein
LGRRDAGFFFFSELAMAFASLSARSFSVRAFLGDDFLAGLLVDFAALRELFAERFAVFFAICFAGFFLTGFLIMNYSLAKLLINFTRFLHQTTNLTYLA